MKSLYTSPPDTALSLSDIHTPRMLYEIQIAHRFIRGSVFIFLMVELTLHSGRRLDLSV